jgi:hypothetical protein
MSLSYILSREKGKIVLKMGGQCVFTYVIKSHNNENPIFILYDSMKTNEKS